MSLARFLHLLLVFGLLCPSLLATRPARAEAASPTAPAGPPAGRGAAQVEETFGRLSLAFAPNRGQAGPSIRYETAPGGASIQFGSAGVTLALPAGRVELLFVGANPAPEIRADRPLPGVVNAYQGNDPAGWFTGVPTYGRITYKALWPGIDLAYEGHTGSLKSTFILAPGADPGRIRLAYPGADSLSVDEPGGLVIRAAGLELREEPPVAWQEIPGRGRVAVVAGYRLVDATSYTFELPQGYNPAYPLLIDPELVYSTYLGGSGETYAYDIRVDGLGNSYILIQSYTPDLNQSNVAILKLNPAGTALVYVTSLGGSGSEYAHSIAVDSAGSAYLVGSTGSPDFPVTPGAYDTSLGGYHDGFVARLNPAGEVVYATFLGGSGYEGAGGIAVDMAGNAYVAGSTSSANFPVTAGAFDTSCGTDGLCNSDAWNHPFTDAFVAKINGDGSQLLYATFLGGSSSESGDALALDGAGNIYLAGGTTSSDFPLTPGAFDSACPATGMNGYADGFVVRVNAGGSALDYATCLGGSNQEYLTALVVDPAGSAYVTGRTTSPNFPVTAGAFRPGPGDNTCDPAVSATCADGFVTKLEPTGAAAYSTYLGGSRGDTGYDLLIDDLGQVYVAGETQSADFPVTADAFDPTYETHLCSYIGSSEPFPCYEGFLARLSASGSALAYGTYWGGSRNDGFAGIAGDSAGALYLAGLTSSADLPTTPGAWAPDYRGGTCGNAPYTYPCTDGFVTKLAFANLHLTKAAPAAAKAGQPITFTLTLTNQTGLSLTNVIISDTIPAGANYVSGGIHSGGVVTWLLPSLAVAATAQVTFVVTASAAITNSVYGVSTAEGLLAAGQKVVVVDIPGFRVSNTSPAGNGGIISRQGLISATFNDLVGAATVTTATFTARGQQAGAYGGVYNTSGNTVQFDAAKPFKPGEELVITLSRGLHAADGTPLHPYTWQVRTEVLTGSGRFANYGPAAPNIPSYGVDLGDLDGDGDLDAFAANNGPNQVWLNNGAGLFSDSGQRLGNSLSRAVGLGDLDGDGDLDAFVTAEFGPNEVWRNNGQGLFSDSGQRLGAETSYALALGDLDGDGDLDAFIGKAGPNEVWLNNGAGLFSDSGQRMGGSGTTGVALGDLDGDGDLDAYNANIYPRSSSGFFAPDEIWLNDGAAAFSDSGQRLGEQYSMAVALGDVDNDGDLDAFIANGMASFSQVWLNDGRGRLTDSGQDLLNTENSAAALGDLDGDGDLDAFAVNYFNEADRVLLNNGLGQFTDTGQYLGNSPGRALGLGDLDGDGDLDAFIPPESTGPVEVWLNQAPPSLAISKIGPVTVTVGEPITYTLTVTNSGEMAATDLLITDTIPAGAAYVSGGTKVGSVVSWTIPSLAGRNFTQTVFVVTATQTITNSSYRVSAAGGYNATESEPVVTVVTDVPLAGLTAATSSPTALGQPTTLTATLTAGTNPVYTWAFGDGETSAGPVVTYTYPATGSYTAIVTASNSTNELSQTTVVEVSQAIAGLAAANDSPTLLGQATTLSATIIAGDEVTYTWTFGDGETGEEPFANHTYPITGTYTAIVTACNRVSLLTATTWVRVDDVPISGLTATNSSPTLIGQQTTLTATLTAGTNPVYTWAFGDGALAAGPVVTHSYPAVAVYTAVITASNSAGFLTETTMITITPVIRDTYLLLIVK